MRVSPLPLYALHTSLSAQKGEYKISAKYFGSQRQDLSGATTLMLTLITNFGRMEQQSSTVALRLSTNKEQIGVGSITIATPITLAQRAAAQETFENGLIMRGKFMSHANAEKEEQRQKVTVRGNC